jgi:VIT1/CCC1 family predicted Fe2+/Mn2+ transporter
MYLISVRAEKAIARRTLETIRSASTPLQAHREIARAMPPMVAGALGVDELERIRLHLLSAGDEVGTPRLAPDDFRAAGAVFLLVFLATLPVALPFVLVDDPQRALWLSHGIAIASLFLAGRALGRQWGQPWQVGLAMVAVGLVLVGIALALGG